MTAKIYVGTYGKYNEGSLDGKWFCLEDYSDKDTFYEACQEFHDRNNPADGAGDIVPSEHEFMFQDWEGIPAQFITECSLDKDIWDYLGSSVDEDIKEAYMTLFDSWNESDCEDHYIGDFESDLNMVYDYVEGTGIIESLPENLQSYFDYKAYARDMMSDGVCEHDHHYFWR